MRPVIIFPIISIVIIFSACGGSRDVFGFGFDKDKGREPVSQDFVHLRNGTLVKGDMTKYKLGLGLLNKKGSVTIDGVVYNAKDIEDFQYDSTYYKRIPGSEKFFYGRKKSGKINLYYRHYVDAGIDSKGKGYHYEYDLHWLQKGKDAPIQKFSLKLLEEMIADNQAASALLEEYKSKKERKRSDKDLNRIIDIYNGKAV